MKIKLLLIAILLLGLSYAQTFSDTNQSDFNLGTYSNTTYNESGVILSGVNTSGTYTSRVFDAASAARWNNLSWQGINPKKEYLYAVDGGGDVYSSFDNGTTWTQTAINYGRTTDTIEMFSDQSYLYIISNSNREVWLSKNGTSFNIINKTFADSGLVLGETASDGDLFVVDASGDVYKSIDYGATWALKGDFNGAATNNGKGMGIGLDNLIYITDGGKGVFSSSDDGATWTTKTSDYGGTIADDLEVDSAGNLYILSGSDIWKSVDSGVSFTKINDDFSPYSNDGFKLLISNNILFIADGPGRVFKSINSGVTWSEVGDFNGVATNNPKGLTDWMKTTNITFQVRNCSQSDCSDGIWKTVNLNDINLTGRYFQYKAYLSSQDSSISPKLYNVSVDYTILDNTPPTFSDYAENPASGSSYAVNQVYMLNVSINETSINKVWIEFNGVNYTSITNISNNYSFSISNLAAGTYSYKWWANDSYGNLNNSGIRYYAISKANGDNIVHLLSSAGWNYNYGIESIFSCDADYGNPKLYKGNIEIANPLTITLGAGTYAIKCNITSSQNYTSGIAQASLSVNKASSQTSLTFDKSSPQTYGTEITPTCSLINGAGALSLTNGTSGVAEILAAGTWNFNCSYSGNENYTQSSNFSQFAINKASQTAALNINESSPIIYGQHINATCNGDLYRNNNLINSEKSQSVLLGAGSYNYSCQILENQNYSYDDDNLTFVVNKASGDISLRLNNQENNATIDYPEQFVVNASTLYGTFSVYKNGEDITGTNGLSITPARIAAAYNITAVSSGDDNHSGTSITRWLNVTLDSTAPEAIIFSPQEDATYGYNNSLPLDFSVSDSDGHLDSCWYNLNSGENVTLPNCGNATFNISADGKYTLHLYANDTLGNEANTNAGFSVQVGYPTITLNSPIGVYLNNYDVVFRYTPSDLDLESCELWGDFTGNFSLNQTQASPMNHSENMFNLTLSDGAYKWNIRCNDSQGHAIFNGNKSFYIDTIAPGIIITNPTGTKTSRTNIPIQLSINDSSPAACRYNVYRGLNLEIANTSINCNNPNSFNLTLDNAEFIFNAYVSDYAGNSNFTSSSFTVSSSGAGSGGSTGGNTGGGGGSYVGNTTKKQIIQLEISSISDMIVNPGENKKITLRLRNTGTSFLNGCRLRGAGENSGWISGTETIGLSVGEIKEQILSLNVPDNINSGKYNIEISANCEETSQGVNFSAEIIEKKLGIELIDIKREGNKARVIYSLSELSNQEQNVNVDVIIFDSDGQKLSETKEIKKIAAGSKQQFEFLVDITDYTKNSISVLINANSEVTSTFLQQEFILGPATGLAIFNTIRSKSSVVIPILIIVFAIIAFFVFTRIKKFKKMAGLHKVKEVSYVKLSEHKKKSEK